MTFEPGGIRQRREKIADRRAAPPSDQEDRHPGEDDDDHQDRNLDEPGKPDPGAAMPLVFWI
jgi:hypothetical protein